MLTEVQQYRRHLIQPILATIGIAALLSRMFRRLASNGYEPPAPAEPPPGTPLASAPERARPNADAPTTERLPDARPSPAAQLHPEAPEGDWGLWDTDGLRAPDRYDADRPAPGRRLRHVFLGTEPTPMPSYMGLIEQPPDEGERIGICCSGGGIRSAAFNLGALQTLQLPEHRRLQRAKYLSAVSGGSYIAAAFAMVAKTKEKEDSDDSDPALVDDDHPPFYHGSPEEQYLRNRSTYLAPAGVGKAHLGLRVAVGLLINLTFLTAGLVLIAWLLSLFYRGFHGALDVRNGHIAAGTTTGELGGAGVLAVLALLLGTCSVFLGSKADHTRQAFETLSLFALVGSALIVLLTMALPELVAALRNQGLVSHQRQLTQGDTKNGLGAAAGGSFAALVAAVLLELRSKLTIKEVKAELSWFRKLSAPLRRAVAHVAAWLLGPLLLFSMLVFALLAFVSARHISPYGPLVAGGVLALFGLRGDVTAWSLHPFYRRRICTAFALKRVPRYNGDTFGQAVERDFRTLVTLSKSGVMPGTGDKPKTWPTLIVCAAANVSDAGATPPGRSVTSFTFSPTTMGGPLVGGIPTEDFEDRIAPSRKRDFTLAAAVAMSGAAISPSMGKETRASFRFLLALANVRLGVWVPNPRRQQAWLERKGGLRTLTDNHVHRHKSGLVKELPGCEEGRLYRRLIFPPRPSPRYLFKEMLGLSSVNDRFLYVTDGGHYENLGLVELLRRGCTEIFCFDASGGTSLSSLGDAIALARSELSVEITDLDTRPLTEKPKTRLAQRCCVRGTIEYPGGRRGTLIYVRTLVTADTPYDVQAFRINDPAFPHHSTLDQLYTDQKFEAYRELGVHAATAAIVEADRAVAAAAQLAPAATDEVAPA